MCTSNIIKIGQSIHRTDRGGFRPHHHQVRGGDGSFQHAREPRHHDSPSPIDGGWSGLVRDQVQQNDQGCRHRVLQEYPKGGIEHSPGSGSDRITRSVTALEAAARESGRDPNIIERVGHLSILRRRPGTGDPRTLQQDAGTISGGLCPAGTGAHTGSPGQRQGHARSTAEQGARINGEEKKKNNCFLYPLIPADRPAISASGPTSSRRGMNNNVFIISRVSSSRGDVYVQV